MAERTEEETVAYTVENRIAWVRYNRPEKRNCMSPALNRQMMRVLEELEFREDVGVLVLSGEGSAFSAGMDLQEYFRDNEAKGLGAIRKSQREAYGWWDRLRWYEKPTIGMVNGWAFGGAYGPLHALDIVVAADDATFGLSEINWGILPGGGASKVAQELMPFRKAIYHAMMGENLTGKQAAEQGLVTESVPAEALKARVTAIAEVLLKKDERPARHQMGDAPHGGNDLRQRDGLPDPRAGGAERHGRAGRAQGSHPQFLDEKTFKPGLGAFDTSKIGQ
jgi:trans-feruloyl-CoA hydratase/vanillin synthase